MNKWLKYNIREFYRYENSSIFGNCWDRRHRLESSKNSIYSYMEQGKNRVSIRGACESLRVAD